MFQNLNKNDKNRNDKNLKMMGISAIILIILFVYMLIKSDHIIQGNSYYFGIVFLFILMLTAFGLQKYKESIKKYIPKNKFQEELENSEAKAQEKTISNTIQAVKTDTTFKDVAGIDEVKEELEEIVDFLNNPKKYKKYDVSLPKGVLLVGPPGVGKTLIAKAVAGEASVPFFYQSGASFVHIYVGMGAKRVRELFEVAKAKAPAIIFIDEIDAVGKARGVGANDEREATLNELLTQMDGFDGNSGVIVIAATNKIEVLDEALLRAGRFDRRVFLALPSKDDRQKILELYLKGKKYNFELPKLASYTSGFSSAALATLVNEALLNMIKRDGKNIEKDDMECAKKKIRFGKKQHYFLNEQEKEILATYQASKAYISKQKVALFDEGINAEDTIYPSKTQLENIIANNLSGSVGLEVILKEPYVVFESELKEAKKIASQVVERYDMATSETLLLQTIKSKLQEKIATNKDEVLKIKDKLLKDEVFEV